MNTWWDNVWWTNGLQNYKENNSRLSYLLRKKHFLIPSLRRFSCNALIQLYFDYACTAWYPNLNKKLKNKIQTTQNKWLRFCLNLDKMADISQNVFKKLSWLPASDRIKQCILSTTFKFFNDIGPNYLNEAFQWAAESNRTLRNDYRKLKHPFPRTTACQNSLFFKDLSKWSKLPKKLESTKNRNNINTFNHNSKKLYLAQLTDQVSL